MRFKLQQAAVTAVLVAMLAVAPHAQAADKPQATTMVTVYVDGHSGSTIAKEVNALHAKMEAQGWKFASLVVHMENSDTKGAWVTYTK